MAVRIDPNDPELGGNGIGGDPMSFVPDTWTYLIKRYNVKNILDIGCGEGHCVKYCNETLNVTATGFDGLLANVQNSVTPIYHHDLRIGPYIIKQVDLVLCCEVVEHIDEKYIYNLLQTLANGKVIAMTHALPGQGGHHHVNCQPSLYWIKHLEAYNYTFDLYETNVARAISPQSIEYSGGYHPSWFFRSGLVFERR